MSDTPSPLSPLSPQETRPSSALALGVWFALALAPWPALALKAPQLALWVSLGVTLALSVGLAISKVRGARWWAWALSGLTLMAIYMALYGVANIVGSGQKFSARGAVSNLRKLLWAERQCAPLTQRPCLLSEMNGQRPPKALTAPLLPSELQRLSSSATTLPAGPISAPIPSEAWTQEVGRIGQYYYRVTPAPQWGKEGWLAYAWPAEDAVLQSFCVSSYEEILERRDRGAYVGLDKAPSPNACLGSLHQDPNPPLTPEMEAQKARGERRLTPHKHLGADGGEWERWRAKRTRLAKQLRP